MHAWLAAFQTQATGGGVLRIGGATLGEQVHATGTAGLDGHAQGRLTLTQLSQQLHGELGGVAGLVGGVEQSTSLNLAGIGITSTNGAEGWAGAGALLGITASHTGGGRFQLGYSFGAALGLGGATNASVAVDASQLLGHLGLGFGSSSNSHGRSH
jgi:hypothetical protein